MPSNITLRKTPLADITQRPLTGRRSNNISAQVVASSVCSGTGEENSPARGLLELFAAAQAGSIGRKRSLKLINEDCENYPPVATTTAKIRSQSTSSTSLVVTSTSTAKTAREVDIPSKSISPLLYNSTAPLSIISTLSRRQTFGQRRNRPFYVSPRSCMLEFVNRPNDVYTFISQDGTTLVPPFSCTYNNVANGARNLAVGDEDGTIHIIDTARDGAHPEKTIQIQAHQNAIFDLCWTRDDSKMISASGDQTARLYDIEQQTCLGTFCGHTGSIKSISLKFNDDNIFATAGRDGAVMIWDVRCTGTTSARGETVYRPANKLTNVHANTARATPPKRSKHGFDGPNTASAVQFMQHNENIVASIGALDGSVKYWDVRKHGTYFKHDHPTPLETSTYHPTTKRAHGMTSMALSPDGRSLYAVSSDNHIYMFNTTALGSPVEQFGSPSFNCSSYYIKISVSPDGNFIAAGSCNDLYVWEVNRPERVPLIFHGHEREVTGVDWARDVGNGTQLSGCSDDATVRTWRPNRNLVQECKEDERLRATHGMVSE